MIKKPYSGVKICWLNPEDKSVAECAVFGVHCEIKGQKPLGLAVLKSGEVTEEQIISKEIICRINSL